MPDPSPKSLSSPAFRPWPEEKLTLKLIITEILGIAFVRPKGIKNEASAFNHKFNFLPQVNGHKAFRRSSKYETQNVQKPVTVLTLAGNRPIPSD